MSTKPNDAVGVIALQHGLSNDSHVELGLTKREYMATAILQGLCANRDQTANESMENLARAAVTQTDCLIFELNNQPAP